MLTRKDFKQAIADTIDRYPALAPLYHAGDPRLHQPLDAMAAMLSLLSGQIELAQAEVFNKVRDGTVLADAAMRGIVRQARPAQACITAENNSDTVITLEKGRLLTDSSGRPWQVEAHTLIPAKGHAALIARQKRHTLITHTVTASQPFYAIEVPQADDDGDLCAIAVSDQQGEFHYRNGYVNAAPDERIFHVEMDERQRLYVRFGWQNVVGTQPLAGDTLHLRLAYCHGAVAPEHGSAFSLDYLHHPDEIHLKLTMQALKIAGSAPPPISALRQLARYPSVYQSHAVFLGEFDFLVRRNHPDMAFVSVWNETTEEVIRGANLDNVNTLFVACQSNSKQEIVITETDPLTPVMPQVITEKQLTPIQHAIKATIRAADDSYKVRFYTPVISLIGLSIHARVSTSYAPEQVKQAIETTLLTEYGQTSAAARRGGHAPLYQAIYTLLRQKVPALADEGADIQVSIAPLPDLRPEQWRFVAASSLTVNVELRDIVSSRWGL